MKSTVASMDECSFKNQKQLASRLMRIMRYYILEVSAQTLFVPHSKSVSFTAKNRFCVPAKDKATARLRESQIKMRT